MNTVNPEKQTPLDPDIVEFYVDLMCRFRPQDVCNFIKMNDGYRLEETLKVCLSSLIIIILHYKYCVCMCVYVYMYVCLYV